MASFRPKPNGFIRRMSIRRAKSRSVVTNPTQLSSEGRVVVAAAGFAGLLLPIHCRVTTMLDSAQCGARETSPSDVPMRKPTLESLLATAARPTPVHRLITVSNALRSPRLLTREVLAGMVTTLALVPAC